MSIRVTEERRGEKKSEVCVCVCELLDTWMLSSARWVQCIMTVKVRVVMRPPRKCCALMLSTDMPAATATTTSH